MKLLHLFSNHKLTGPAAPAVRLAAELVKRGHEVTFAHSPMPAQEPGYIDGAAAELGLRTTTEFRLPKHFNLLALFRDARKLAGYIDANGVDIVHCNLLNDHLTAVVASSHCRKRPKIVRTNHDAVPLRPHIRNRYVLSRRTDALMELSRKALEKDRRTFSFPEERIFLVDTPIDLPRFDPARSLPDARRKLGLSESDFAVGVAARIQKRRRFHVLLDAAVIARRHVPNLKLVVIGRGTKKESVAVKPARKRGLEDIVLFPGYLRGDDYVAGLMALDTKVFLVPGTDGSCRAAREAMSMGKPVIAARRGMLPELVTDGETGLVIDDTPGELAEAIIRLARDAELRRRMSEAARRTALRRFDPAAHAEKVEEAYRLIST